MIPKSWVKWYIEQSFAKHRFLKDVWLAIYFRRSAVKIGFSNSFITNIFEIVFYLCFDLFIRKLEVEVAICILIPLTITTLTMIALLCYTILNY